MRLAVLGSGSGGNSLIVESAGRRILIDAGFSCREIEKRLRALGEQAARLDAVLLTHEHQDHLRGVARLVRRFDLPLFATAGTLSAADFDVETRARARVIRSGEPFEVPGRGLDQAPVFRAEAFAVPHDAREPVGFVVEDPHGRRLGLVADLGSRTQLAWGRLHDLDALVIETNHDLRMLRNGPYPWHLKQRIAGRHGHLANHEAAAGLPELLSDRLRWVVLYHLSQINNLPALAAQAIGEQLDREGARAEVTLTWQDQTSPWLDVG